ncbi:MAG: ribosome small subunit-dependent GTPase A [Alphaproteobacteria bacterium]|nr:ribosome small subunit-dependent GTPase A [Alphaproteobacteria bacterium]
MTLVSLEALGFDDHFSARLDALGDPSLVPARVTAAWPQRLRLLTPSGPRDARPPREGPPPAVGDWVALPPAEDDLPFAAALLPRKGALVRQAAGVRTADQVLAANLDRVFIVTAMNRDFNLRRVERTLVLVDGCGAEPVIVLNKSDLDPAARGRYARQLMAVAPGVPVAVTSALHDDTLGELEAWLGRGLTVALIGSSGVGKSTLVNRLLGDEIQDTGGIRGGDDRGRHTTTHRELFVLPGDRGVLIDTPGVRELQLTGAEDLSSVFGDLEALAERCQFRDCGHEGEPGCAIEVAVEAGEVDPARVVSWQKLQREQERQLGRRAAWETRQEHRRFSRMAREAQADRKRRRR